MTWAPHFECPILNLEFASRLLRGGKLWRFGKNLSNLEENFGNVWKKNFPL
jgi:hypothetical protein